MAGVARSVVPAAAAPAAGPLLRTGSQVRAICSATNQIGPNLVAVTAFAAASARRRRACAAGPLWWLPRLMLIALQLALTYAERSPRHGPRLSVLGGDHDVEESHRMGDRHLHRVLPGHRSAWCRPLRPRRFYLAAGCRQITGHLRQLPLSR